MKLRLLLVILSWIGAAHASEYRGYVVSTDNDRLVIRTQESTRIVFSMRRLPPAALEALIAANRSGSLAVFQAPYGAVITSEYELTGTPYLPSTFNATNVRDSDHVLFRTRERAFNIDLRLLPPETAATIREALVLRYDRRPPREVNVSIPPAAAAVVPNDIRPNCSETQVSDAEMDELATRAVASGARDGMIRFLQSIPPHSMQRFTFVYESQSAQRDGVSRQWPRVIRFNRDGTHLMTYTCNPNSESYGTVEEIRWDAAARRFVFSERDFRPDHLDVREGRPSPHRTMNPKSCNTCHSPPSSDQTPDPRPNWASYFFWRGVYGSGDDRLHPNRGVNIDDRNAYREFRRNQRNNPCYSSLPWPPENDPTFSDSMRAVYPYRQEGNVPFDYRVRPNLLLNDTLSHLAAQRLARRFEADPRYQSIRYLLAMEALGGCGVDLDRELAHLVPGYRPPQFASGLRNDVRDGRNFGSVGVADPRVVSAGASRLYSVGEMFGFSPRDWTLTAPNRSDSQDPSFFTGIVRIGFRDAIFSAFVQGALINNLVDRAPELRQFFELSRDVGNRQFFGPMSACIDDYGGEVRSGYSRIDRYENGTVAYETDNTRRFCQALRERHRLVSRPGSHDEEGNACFPDPTGLNLTQIAQVAGQVQRVVRQAENSPITEIPLTRENIERGQRVAAGQCRECHASGSPRSLGQNLRFFENNESLRAFAAQGGRRNILSRVLEHDPGDRMPPQRSGLSTPDIQALDAYIRSLTR